MTRSAKREAYSEIAAAMHETAEGMFRVGLIDARKMREFDHLCFLPVDAISPEEIRAIRRDARVSQPVFARCLNVSKNLVSDWERGVKKPGGPALRLLALVKKKGLGVLA